MKLKTRLLVLGIVAVSFATSACVNVGTPVGFGPVGMIFTYTKIGTGGQPGGAREGKACAYRILPITWYGFAFGTVDIHDAAQDGGITIIKSVERLNLDVLSIFTRVCTVVHGDSGSVPGIAGSATVTGFGDTVTLKNGSSFANCKAAVTGDSVVVTTTDGKTIVLQKSEVQSVKKGN